LDVSSELGWFCSNGLDDMLVGYLDNCFWLKGGIDRGFELKVGLAKLNFRYLTPSKWASSKTQTTLIPFQTIQNHALDVSSELGWF
jgi:hypothetical protein